MAFIAIDTDPTETEEYIREYRDRNGFFWPKAANHRKVITDYKVIVQSTKFGIDQNGVIVLKGGYGTQSADEWRRWLKTLAGE